MRSPILVLFLLFVSSEIAVAQNDSIQIYKEFNRLEDFFALATESVIRNYDVEPVPEQVEAFKELLAQKKELDIRLHEVFQNSSESEKRAGVVQLTASLEQLKSVLTEEILLPHQVALLNQKQFADLLDRYKGDFATVVKKYYGEEFGLTNEQKEARKKIKEEFARKKGLIDEEYRAKLLKIKTESQNKLDNLFTLRQRQLIERHTGRKINRPENGEGTGR